MSVYLNSKFLADKNIIILEIRSWIQRKYFYLSTVTAADLYTDFHDSYDILVMQKVYCKIPDCLFLGLSSS